MEFSTFLNNFIDTNNLTNRDVAKKTGINETIVSMIKHKKRIATYDFIIRFFMEYDIPQAIQHDIIKDVLDKKLPDVVKVMENKQNDVNFLKKLTNNQKEKFEKLKNTMIMALTLNDIKPTDEIIEQITRNAEDIFSKEYLNKIT